MAGTIVGNRIDWDGEVSEDGHQTFPVTYLIETDDPEDGPNTVLQTPGLPLCGAILAEGNDFNPHAFASCAKSVKRHQPRGGDPHTHWAVKVPFSTKGRSRCCDTQFEDPLNEPQKVSFSTEVETKEALKNRYGEKIVTSSHEVIRGPQNEWEEGRFKVTIVQHVLDPEVGLLSRFLANGGTLNDSPMWGFPEGCIRFCAPCGVEELYFGACQKYFKRTLTFDVRAEGHDREVPDEGTKALYGHWGTAQGSGATVNIASVASGGILTASLSAGGSGYPRSATVFLTVTGGGGTGGIVKVRTNSSGVCISDDFEVYQSGTGYSTGSSLATDGGGGGWVLDDVRNPCTGATGPPDKDNPAHFSRYKDRDGNPTTVILDGEGVPYDPCNSAEEEKWWCLNDGLVASVAQGKCFEIIDLALALSTAGGGNGVVDFGMLVSGPFDSEAEAEAQCSEDSYGAGVPPLDVVCGTSRPGSVLIARCPLGDLFRLGVPLVIGGP